MIEFTVGMPHSNSERNRSLLVSAISETIRQRFEVRCIESPTIIFYSDSPGIGKKTIDKLKSALICKLKETM